MDGSSPYQLFEKEWRYIKAQRGHEDVEFAAHVQQTMSDIENERDAKLAKHNADAKADETKLAEQEKEKSDALKSKQSRELNEIIARHRDETADRERASQMAMSKLEGNQKAKLEKLEDTYATKKADAEAKIERMKITVENDRAAEDVELHRDLIKTMDEQSSQTIEVDSPGIAIATAGQPLQRILNFKARQPVSAASAVEESPIRGIAQVSSLSEDPQTPQPRPRVSNQVTPTKRSMTESPGENRLPPSLRRVVSENIRPAADEDVFNSPSSQAFSEVFLSPSTLLSTIPNPPPASPTRPISISSASSQSTTHDSQQVTQPATPQVNGRQTIGANGSTSGMSLQSPADMSRLPATPSRSTSFATPPRAKLQSQLKPVSQPRSFSSGTPRLSTRSSSQHNPSPPSAQLGRPICVNFEIISVRYNYAVDGGSYSWTYEADQPTRYLRLSENAYRPVLKNSKKCGTAEWYIDPSRVWFLKYNLKAALLYVNRSKAGAKTGNAGKEMWVKFKDEEILNRFLKSYKDTWPHTKIDELSLGDDDVPLSMWKNLR